MNMRTFVEALTVDDMRTFVEALTVDEMNELSSIIHQVRTEIYRSQAFDYPLTEEEYNMMCKGQRVSAIIQFRKRRELSLSAAKAIAEVNFDKRHYTPSNETIARKPLKTDE